MPAKLLSGLRVLDLADEKGLLCGKMLADMGADVVKVEKPGGDPARNIPPFYHDMPGPENSLYWFAYNMNKRSITLNLESTRGQDLFKRLIYHTDIVIESFLPGYLDRFGLNYKTLSEINPLIIMTSITAFGQNGPYSRFTGSDLVIEALGVMLSQYGYPDRAPVRIGIPQAYMLGGANAAEGTMIAYYYRRLSGEGQHVDVSLMESVLWTASIGNITTWNASRKAIKRAGNLYALSGNITPNVWECEDGFIMFLILGGLMGVKTNKALTRWMDEEGMAPGFMKEKDWANWDGFKATKEEINAIVQAIEPFFKSHTGMDLQSGAIERGIMLYKVSDSKDTFDSPQLKARDFWVNVKHEALGGMIRSPGPFARLSLTPIEEWRRPPLVGEDNRNIYKDEMGISDRKLLLLQKDGVI